MKRKLPIIVAMVMMCAGLVLSQTAYADAPAPLNQIAVDITLNDAGYMTVGGIDLKALGVGQIDSQATTMVKNMDTARVVLQGELVSVDVHGTPVLKMQWNQSSRQVMANLATRYGVQLSTDLQSRIEEWITSSNLDVTARFSNQPSKPAVIKMTKPILVDFGANGQVTVEKMPLAYGIEKSVFDTIKMGGIQNATLCWNKGTILTKVDGKDLPSITLDPKGALYLTKAFNLAITDVDPIFAAVLGVDASMPGGTHAAGATCGSLTQ